MRRVIWLAAVIALVAAACGSSEPELDPAAVERGAFVYEGPCQVCHEVRSVARASSSAVGTAAEVPAGRDGLA